MKTPPKNNNALFCQKQNRAKSDSRFSAGAVWIHGYGGNTSYLLRGFSHPDFTVGFGISPNQPAFPLARRLRHKRRSLPVLNCTVP